MTTYSYGPALPTSGQLIRLGKPRVVSLIVFTAVIGMFLATPGLPPLGALLFGTIGIALVASSAAALNCLIEQKLDATMARTRARPLPMGAVTPAQALVFIALVGGTGLLVLHELTNWPHFSATQSSTRFFSSRARRRTSSSAARRVRCPRFSAGLR